MCLHLRRFFWMACTWVLSACYNGVHPGDKVGAEPQVTCFGPSCDKSMWNKDEPAPASTDLSDDGIGDEPPMDDSGLTLDGGTTGSDPGGDAVGTSSDGSPHDAPPCVVISNPKYADFAGPPYIQDVSTTSALLAFQLPVGADATIDLGASPDCYNFSTAAPSRR